MAENPEPGGSGPGAPGCGPVLVVLAAGQARRFGGCKPLARVGPNGEAIVDLLAADALRAGFASIVMVVNPDTGPLLRAHVGERWPEELPVGFAVQDAPRGTVDAVLAARALLDPMAPFAVANADDCYGSDALAFLVDHLSTAPPRRSPRATREAGQLTVAFRLGRTLLGRSRVNRGICEVGPDGRLRGLAERREVGLEPDGSVSSRDGRRPARLDPMAPTAVNLWGFDPSIWPLLEAAVADRAVGPGEVLIPEVVGRAVGGGLGVRVTVCEGDCVGVTHPDDLALVRQRLATQVAEGQRPRHLWPTVGCPVGGQDPVCLSPGGRSPGGLGRIV